MKEFTARYSHVLDFEGSVNAFLAKSESETYDVIAMLVPNSRHKPYTFSGVLMAPDLAESFWRNEICLRSAMELRGKGATWLTSDRWPDLSSDGDEAPFRETPLLPVEDIPEFGLFSSMMMTKRQSRALMRKLGFMPERKTES
ncbi:hypothetical protein [Salipiger mucosus]|uniref:Uncharacterized protein n=1 Tax=Salipiger mucosus DSM 16094 TaxID=1123237 RepID=S9QDG4_9RHOB|nr:hypothetical protein [Salipiger mucosus]EPX77967.1 hypothetical protein Salmuc_03289 [Salipiger mucosus DSM 16094]